MKATLLFCLLAAGASIALARYKSSDFSKEGILLVYANHHL